MKKIAKLFSALSVAPVLGTTLTMIGYQEQVSQISKNENILLGQQKISDQWQLQESQYKTDEISLFRHETSQYGSITSLNKFISATYSKNVGNNYTYVVDLSVKRNNLNSTHDFLFNETVNLANQAISYPDLGTAFTFKLPTTFGVPGIDPLYNDSIQHSLLSPNHYQVLKQIINDYYNRDVSDSKDPTDMALMPYDDGSGKSIDDDSTRFSYVQTNGNTYHIIFSVQWYLTTAVDFKPKLSEELDFNAYVNLNLKDPSFANNGLVTIPALFNVNKPISSVNTIPPSSMIERNQKMNIDLGKMMMFDYWSTFNQINTSGISSVGSHMILPMGEVMAEVEYVNKVTYLSNKGDNYSFAVNLQPMETGSGLHKAININSNLNVDTMQFSFPSLGNSFSIKLNSNEIPGTTLNSFVSFDKQLESKKSAVLYKMMDGIVNIKLEKTNSDSDYYCFRPISKNPVVIDNSTPYSNVGSWFKDLGKWGNYEAIQVSLDYKDIGDNIAGGNWLALYYNNLENPKDVNNNTLIFPDLLNVNTQ